MRRLVRILYAGLLVDVATSNITFNQAHKNTCGYDSCEEYDPKVLNVHIVPHTHNDVAWLKTFDQYYYGTQNNIQKVGVQYILDSVIKELWRDPRRKFVYAETAFFWKWWQHQSETTRFKVDILVGQGQLQFAGGAWSVNDEATTHYQSIIDQFTWGLSKINDIFGSCGRPLVGWQIDTSGHSREFASLLAAMGYDGLFLSRIDYQDRKKRLDLKEMEMLWRGDDDLGKSSDIFTSVLYKGYHYPKNFCFDINCVEDPIIDDTNASVFNINEFNKRLMSFVNLTRQQAKHYRTNNVLVPMGGDFMYENAAMWYTNMDKMIEYINSWSKNKGKKKLKLFYSTPACYLKAVRQAKPHLPGKQDDFFPYASNATSYWTGYYTSRPTLKYFEREANRYFQMVKQMQILAALPESNTPILENFKSAMGVMQHHDSITGTERQHVAKDLERMLHRAIEKGVGIASTTLNKMMQTKSHLHFKRCKFNESSCPTTEHSDQFIVAVYNPLGWNVSHVVRLPVKRGEYDVFEPGGNIIISQLVEIPLAVKEIPSRQSRAFQEIYFIAKLAPVSYKTFYIIKKITKSEKEKDHSPLVEKRQVIETRNVIDSLSKDEEYETKHHDPETVTSSPYKGLRLADLIKIKGNVIDYIHPGTNLKPYSKNIDKKYRQEIDYYTDLHNKMSHPMENHTKYKQYLDVRKFKRSKRTTVVFKDTKNAENIGNRSNSDFENSLKNNDEVLENGESKIENKKDLNEDIFEKRIKREAKKRKGTENPLSVFEDGHRWWNIQKKSNKTRTVAKKPLIKNSGQNIPLIRRQIDTKLKTLRSTPPKNNHENPLVKVLKKNIKNKRHKFGKKIKYIVVTQSKNKESKVSKIKTTHITQIQKQKRKKEDKLIENLLPRNSNSIDSKQNNIRKWFSVEKKAKVRDNATTQPKKIIKHNKHKNETKLHLNKENQNEEIQKILRNINKFPNKNVRKYITDNLYTIANESIAIKERAKAIIQPKKITKPSTDREKPEKKFTRNIRFNKVKEKMSKRDKRESDFSNNRISGSLTLDQKHANFDKLIASKRGISKPIEANFSNAIDSGSLTGNQKQGIFVKQPTSSTLVRTSTKTGDGLNIKVTNNAVYSFRTGNTKKVTNYSKNTISQLGKTAEFKLSTKENPASNTGEAIDFKNSPKVKVPPSEEAIEHKDSTKVLKRRKRFKEHSKDYERWLETQHYMQADVEQIVSPVVYYFDNEYWKLRVKANGEVSHIIMNNTEIHFKPQFYYYTEDSSFDPNLRNRQDSGAYIFSSKLIDSINQNLTSFITGPIVQEIRLSATENLHSIFRLYNNINYLEIEWIVGPIDVSDNIGKQYVVKYATDLGSNGEFYTDSNGRQMLKRKINARKTWKVNLDDHVAGNYYPITNKIYIEGGNYKLAVLTDRAQGGSSLADGEIEVMLHRRLLHDDGMGLSEDLNEELDGKGLTVRGTHRLILSKRGRKTDYIYEKKQGIEFHSQPTVLVADASHLLLSEWLELSNLKFAWCKQNLPEGIHLLTLEPWDDGTMLLRLENYLEIGDKLDTTVYIDLNSIFTTIQVIMFTETMLAGNILVRDYNKTVWQKDGSKFSKNFNQEYWNMNYPGDADEDDKPPKDTYTKISLRAKQIRTFVIKYRNLVRPGF